MRTIVVIALSMFMAGTVVADEFTKEDQARWMAQFDQVAAEGRRLWNSPEIGTNGVACGQCHPNAANTHPETYPKFQQQLGKIASLRDMINWCIQNPGEGEPLALHQRVAVMRTVFDAIRFGIEEGVVLRIPRDGEREPSRSGGDWGRGRVRQGTLRRRKLLERQGLNCPPGRDNSTSNLYRIALYKALTGTWLCPILKAWAARNLQTTGPPSSGKGSWSSASSTP